MKFSLSIFFILSFANNVIGRPQDEPPAQAPPSAPLPPPIDGNKIFEFQIYKNRYKNTISESLLMDKFYFFSDKIKHVVTMIWVVFSKMKDQKLETKTGTILVLKNASRNVLTLTIANHLHIVRLDSQNAI